MNKKILVISILIFAIFLLIFSRGFQTQEEIESSDLTVQDYLEENIAWTVYGGEKFCSFIVLNQNYADELYLNVLCQEYYLEDGFLKEGSGLAGPVKIILEGDEPVDYWMPEDGSKFTETLKQGFGEYYQVYINSRNEHDNLRKENLALARSYFNADIEYRIEESLQNSCNKDTDCQTPSEYLIRSDCPYQTFCIDNVCTVVCPSF